MTTSTDALLEGFHVFSLAGVVLSASIFIFIGFVYALSNVIYNLYFHPLKHIPGPFLARASGIPYNLRMRNGDIAPWLQKAHAKYGEAVRINPTEVSFISGETAWQDIYGFHTGKNKKSGPYLKDRQWFPQPLNGTWSIIASDEEAHTRMRRNLSHAFSEKALREQEGLIQGFVNQLISSMHEMVDEGVPAVNIMRWYNYTTFDIIADLTFGEPLYCLRDKGYHPWVHLVFANAKAIGLIAARKKYPMFDYYDRFLGLFKDQSKAIRMRKEFFALTKKKVGDRIEMGTERPDFMTAILKNQGAEEKALSRDEMDSNAIILLIAGSETTATMLSGTTYMLLRTPEAYAKVVHEIRSHFKSQDEITIDEVNKLDYMIACLTEGLRYYPPVPTGFPRRVPQGGDNISGHYIPEGMSVYMSQHAANHSPRNFTNPEVFAPERWLGDPRYVNDNRAAYNPFSFGPRNCLGKNLAYAEMRLILAKVLFNFDLELVDQTDDWMARQKVFTLWEKPDLNVRITPARR